MEALTRICLTGPECTGKTTLAGRLASFYGAAWSPEYAREHALACGHVLSAPDVGPIARGQIANEDRAIGDAVRGTVNRQPSTVNLVVHDTDLLSTVIYARWYYGDCPSWIEEEARRRRADLYLLMDTDLEWTADPARDSPGDAREDLFDAFRATLDEFEARFVIVSGVGEARWEGVRRAVELLLQVS